MRNAHSSGRVMVSVGAVILALLAGQLAVLGVTAAVAVVVAGTWFEWVAWSTYMGGSAVAIVMVGQWVTVERRRTRGLVAYRHLAAHLRGERRG